MSLSINIPPGLYVGGQTLQGVAELHFPRAVDDEFEEVHIKLRGSVDTRVRHQVGLSRQTRTEKVQILHQNQSLWSKGLNQYPPLGSRLLRIPFQFVLPPNLPPSCQLGCPGKHGTIDYFVELVGVRNGVFTRHKRARRPLLVVAADPEGEQVASMLRDPVVQYWFAVASAQKDIRLGILEGPAQVKMELSFPNFARYPPFTPIPFSLHVVVITKHTNIGEVEKWPNQEIFPILPTDPTAVRFRLKQRTWFKAHSAIASVEDVTPLGGLERPDSAHPVSVKTPEGEWVPSRKDQEFGGWTQDVTFCSTFELRCSPSFETAILGVQYKLEARVTFPDLGNDLELEVPILVSSGETGELPRYSPPAVVQSHMLDLPSYCE